MTWYGKTTFLFYDGRAVANYKIYCENDNHCEVELNLFYPFNRRKAILSDINVGDYKFIVIQRIAINYKLMRL